jgi:hypothetical protein
MVRQAIICHDSLPTGSMVAFIRQRANGTGEIFIVGVYGGEPRAS